MESHEEEARRLLAAELERNGYGETLYAVRNGWKLPGLPECALRAIVAALQQAQQPDQSFNEWFAEFDKQNHYPELLAREAWNAALRSQQPGAQAVEPFGHVYRIAADCLSPDRPWSKRFEGMPFELGPAPKHGVKGIQYLNLYTDPPPPLPEGVSEEDVDAALKVKWPLHYNVMSAARLAYERDDMRKILESYRARLAAKGGV